MPQKPRTPSLKNDPSTQHACFLETARALGCDEDEAVFDEKLKAVVKPSLLKSGNPGANGTDSGNGRRKPKAE